MIFGTEDQHFRSPIYKDSNLPIFYEMAAIITSQNRASKNYLRRNFLDHKRKQGCKIKVVKLDCALRDAGTKMLEAAIEETAQEEIENILSATTMNEVEFRKFQTRIEGNKDCTEEAEWNDFRRTHLELFYGQPVSESLIVMDDKGRFRKKCAMFMAIKENPILTIPDENQTDWETAMAIFEASLKTIKNRHSAAALLNELLNLTPIWSEGRFETAIVLKSTKLAEFAKACLASKIYVDAQLEVRLRRDIEKKPMTFLNVLLNLVGMKVEPIATKKTGGKKEYLYQLDGNFFAEMEEIVKRKNSENAVGWPFVNKLHGFQYSAIEFDWLMDN